MKNNTQLGEFEPDGDIRFDYANQAWLVNGKYISCAHSKPCNTCFGTVHQGELAAPNAEIK